MYADTRHRLHEVARSARRSAGARSRCEYNIENDIDPQTIRQKVSDILLSLGGDSDHAPTPKKRAAQAARAPRDAAPRSWSG